MTGAIDSEAFASLYPDRAGPVRHGLADHPLLTLEALAGLAARIDPATVEYNRGDLPIGVAPDATPANGLSIAATIASIEDNGSWMVLKFVERDPAYAALLDATLAPLAAITDARTGRMLKREAFVFVSSPRAMTPYHFDPEHNILLQIRGTKAFTAFPPDDIRYAAAIEHERFHLGGHRNLPWSDALASGGTTFTLSPGDGVHVPVMAPHFVRNGDAVSISLSVTWRSEASHAKADAHAFNAMLRLAGLNPAPLAGTPRAKALAWRAIRRVRASLAG